MFCCPNVVAAAWSHSVVVEVPKGTNGDRAGISDFLSIYRHLIALSQEMICMRHSKTNKHQSLGTESK